jgi:cytochrome c biogenesis protein CcmG/thiol:disulfide interchange protein DsbE
MRGTRALATGDAGLRRGGLVLLAVLAGAVLAGVAAYLAVPGPTQARTPTATSGPGKGLPVIGTGRRAPAFRLPRLGGGPPVSLAAERGHPVVVNFFASWCPECRAELQAFATASERARTVRFIGVDTNDPTPSKAGQLLRAAGARYPVGVDSSASTASSSYGIVALPATVFVYPDGRVAGQVYGAQTVSTLRSWTDRLERGSRRG